MVQQDWVSVPSAHSDLVYIHYTLPPQFSFAFPWDLPLCLLVIQRWKQWKLIHRDTQSQKLFQLHCCACRQYALTVGLSQVGLLLPYIKPLPWTAQTHYINYKKLQRVTLHPAKHISWKIPYFTNSFKLHINVKMCVKLRLLSKNTLILQPYEKAGLACWK